VTLAVIIIAIIVGLIIGACWVGTEGGIWTEGFTPSLRHVGTRTAWEDTG